MKYFAVKLGDSNWLVVKASSMRVAINRAIERHESLTKTTAFRSIIVEARLASPGEIVEYQKNIEEPIAAHNAAMRNRTHDATTCAWCNPGSTAEKHQRAVAELHTALQS